MWGVKERVAHGALPRMRPIEAQLDLIEHSAHILRQILEFRAETALLRGMLSPLDEHVGLDLAAELAAEVATHQLQTVLYVPHVERTHQEFLGLLPAVEVLRTTPRNYHQDYQA